MGYFILLLIIIVYLIRPAEWIPALYFNWNMLLSGLAILPILGSVLNKTKSHNFDIMSLFLVWFICSMILSSIFNFQFGKISDYYINMFFILIVYLLTQVSINTTKKVDNIILIIILLLLFISYQCYLQATAGINWGGLAALPRDDGFQAIWFGTFKDPNDLGMILVIFFPYLINRIFYQSLIVFKSIFWLICLLVISYTIFLTNSRGTMLALIASMSAFYIIKNKSLYGFVLAVLVSLVLLMFGPSRMGELTSGDYSAMGRVYAWIEALQVFAINPLFGIGADYWVEHHGRTTHNSYVLAFAENGMVGFIPYLSLFIVSISTAIKIAYTEQNSKLSIEIISLVSGLIGMCISMFFISRTYVLVPYLYIGILMAYLRVYSADLYWINIKSISLLKLSLYSCFFIAFIYAFNRFTTVFLL